MLEYNYAELKDKRYKYSKDYWYIDLKDGELILVGNQDIHHFYRFEQLHKYLYDTYIKNRPRRKVIIYTRRLHLIMRYYLNAAECQPALKDAINPLITHTKREVDHNNGKLRETVTACTVLNFINYRDILYYLGTDEIDNYDDVRSLMDRFAGTHASKGFSGRLKDIFFDDIKQNNLTPFAVLKACTDYGSLSSVVGVQTCKEFKNVHSYDFSSAFISWLIYNKFPTNFRSVRVLERKAGYVHLIKIKFYGLKTKATNFRTLSRVRCTDMSKVQTSLNTRICAAEEFVYVFFYELEMPVINQSYTYDNVEILECWESKLEYLPAKFRDKVLTFAKDKQEKKKSGQSYKAYKVILNRIWGMLVTYHERNGLKLPLYQGMPFAWGYYVIALQKNLMMQLVYKIDEKNIVHMHTDSIKTTINIDDFVDQLNNSRPLQYGIGLLEKECVYDKIYYFSAVRCKYLLNKKVGMKHGGIRKEDYEEFIKDKTYNQIKANSQIKITKSEDLAIVGDKTEIIKQYTTSVIAEDKNYGIL